MNIYQNMETGMIFEGYVAPSIRYIKIGAWCEACGKRNDVWEWSNFCSICRDKYHSTTASNYETRPYNLNAS